MAGVKIIGFLGTAPKLSPELLPNTAGQIATNCKLYSGDLIPYPQPTVIANTSRTGTIKTLFALRDPDTGDKKWLSWLTEVDIAVASKTDQDEQRFYYSGDGAPKVSNYELATTGAAPYPVGYYDLGLPIPPDSSKLTTTAAAFSTLTTSSFARDASNTATIVTSTAHGLKSGNLISVTQFAYRTGTYNQAGSTTITVTITGHGLSNGASVLLDFTSGTATDGTFTITNATTNTFDVVASTSATTSGDVRWDIRGFNATNVECTVVDSTTLTYFSPGPRIATTSSSSGRVDLGGLPQARSYVFTWYTPWDEESIASTPSDNLYIKEGITVKVSDLPTVKPSGNNFVRGLRLYRTLASASGTEYFRLSTLWFPTGLVSVQRTSNVSRVTLQYPHNLGIDDRFMISGCSEASFNITGGIVTDIIDDYTFTYAQVASNISPTAVASGTLYHDVSEYPPTSTARYWGATMTGTYNQPGTTTVTITILGHGLRAGMLVYLTVLSGSLISGQYLITSVLSNNSFTVTVGTATSIFGGISFTLDFFVDDFDSRDLFDILASDDYDAPPEDLQGLTAIQNNILCGFVGNTLYFSEPGLPHAWPAKYAVTLEHNVVGVASISGSVLVVTDAYPYLVSGSDPANGMATARVDANFPCLNKNSIVTMGYGIVYSTHDGLAVYSPSSGLAIITKLLYNNDTWQTAIDPSTVIAEYYGDNYFASHSTGAFVFEQDTKVGGFFVNAEYSFTASWYDAVDGIVYYVSGTNGDIYQWDDLDQPLTTQEWKSKVIVAKDMINLGAARVVADYSVTSEDWDVETTLWEAATENWDLPAQLTFRLWVDKELILETTINDSEVFRLPTGYRTDTFEVGVEGNIRVRAIHLAETPIGLRSV